MEPESKSFLASKTIITNLLILILAKIFGPQVREYITEDVVMMIMALINIILRFISSGKIHMMKKTE